MIKQPNEFASVLGVKYSDRIGSNYYRKKRAMEAEYQRKNKSEQIQMRYDDYMLKVLETFEVLVCTVLVFIMYHINN